MGHGPHRPAAGKSHTQVSHTSLTQVSQLLFFSTVCVPFSPLVYIADILLDLPQNLPPWLETQLIMLEDDEREWRALQQLEEWK